MNIDSFYYINSLPSEVMLSISEYLELSDIGRYKRTSKKSNQSLNFRVSTNVSSTANNLRNFHDHPGYTEWYKTKRCADLGQFPRNTHTAWLSFNGVDQGWGNRKGRIYISESEVPFPSDNNEECGKLITTSPIFEHRPRNYVLKFRPKQDKFYAVSYHVGGGGGHQLYMRNPVIKAATVHLDQNV